MTKTEYANYLQSEHWRKLRREFIEASGNKCERCEIPRWLAEIAYDQDLHVHHKSYANLGNESLDDLEVLCRRCHDIETFGRSELREPKSAICEMCAGTHWNPRSSLCPICDEISGSGNLPFFFRMRDVEPSGIQVWQRLLREMVWAIDHDGLAAELPQYMEQIRQERHTEIQF